MQIQILNEQIMPKASISLYSISNLPSKYDYMNDMDATVNPYSNSTIA